MTSAVSLLPLEPFEPHWVGLTVWEPASLILALVPRTIPLEGVLWSQLRQIETQLRGGQITSARTAIQRLLDSLSTVIELAHEMEVRLRCGLALYTLGDFGAAQAQFRHAAEYWPMILSGQRTGLTGLSRWLEARAQWENPAEQSAALENFQLAIAYYTKAAEAKDLAPADRAQLHPFIDQLRVCLADLKPAARPNSAPRPPTVKLQFRQFDVYAGLRASPRGGLVGRQNGVYVEVETLLIDGRLHQFHNVENQRVIPLTPNERYLWVRVHGPSLNQATPCPVEDGDYVLVRQKDDPAIGQLVAAILENEQDESPAVLKRRKRDGLHSESADPTLNAQVISLEKVAKFIGDVLAVAKPLARP